MNYTPHIILAVYLLGLLALGIASLLKSRNATHAEADYSAPVSLRSHKRTIRWAL